MTALIVVFEKYVACRLPKSLLAEHLLCLLLFSVLTVSFTWPLANPAIVTVPSSDDAYFSIWRMAWVAHQLPINPATLFDANVFYPARDTLAYSDAMLLVGMFSAPLFWLGFEPARIHNFMLLAAFVTSMWATYLLAKRLTLDRFSAFLAAVIFGYCPYRFAHIGHLELQWVMWMPLSLLALHRLVERPTLVAALLLGAALAAQAMSSIYYGVFLALCLAVAWMILIARAADRGKVARVTAFAILPLIVAVAIYGPPYARSREASGPRRPAEIVEYSAVPRDYLRVPPDNRLFGIREQRQGADERSLFPGAVALLLAVLAFWPPVSRVAWLYGVLAVVAFDASLGPNGVVFPFLQRAAPIITSLRAPARFGVLVALSLSLLAALSAARLRGAGRWGTFAVIVALIASLAENYSAPVSVRQYTTRPSGAHQFLKTLPSDTVILELPVPTLSSLWLYETTYQVRSTFHWKKLINGYSAFVPRGYAETLELMKTFPDDRSVRRLERAWRRFRVAQSRLLRRCRLLVAQGRIAAVAAVRESTAFRQRPQRGARHESEELSAPSVT